MSWNTEWREMTPHKKGDLVWLGWIVPNKVPRLALVVGTNGVTSTAKNRTYIPTNYLLLCDGHVGLYQAGFTRPQDENETA